MRSARLAVSLAACASLAGCGVTRGLESPEPAPWVQAGSPQPATNAESLLLYFAHLKKLAVADLAKEHESARQAYGRARTDFNRVRYAMVLALPGTAFSDAARAIEVLEPVAKNANGQLHALALMLASQLQEQRRIEAGAQALQQKLDALRSLERTLIERKR
ncbi:MAG TPA: hypothetical protein VNK67_15550 [Burkholderiales bacterium]|nr:hypothetical protein [Burkholderiales bacterium]